MATSTSLPIGALARDTGVKVPTIRFYETIGLLARPDRTASNRRVYGPDTVRRLKFIRHSRELGFEVDAIRQLLKLADHPDMPCREADLIAREHLEDIDSKLARLAALRAEVQRMVDQCAHETIADCRVIEVLANHDECLHPDHKISRAPVNGKVQRGKSLSKSRRELGPFRNRRAQA